MESSGFTPKVMIVSNQQTTGPLWVFSLQQQQIGVVLEPSPSSAFSHLALEIPDLLVLDINVSDDVILDYIKKFRTETNIPILLLIYPKPEDFLLKVYEAGADECILKPVGPSLFHAKIRVWLRRSWTVPANALDVLTTGDIQIDPASRTVVVRDGEPIRLTNLEFRLLYLLMGQINRTLPTDELVQRIWGLSSSQETEHAMLKNVVYRLRRKIETDPANPQIIQNVPGVGYRFVNE